MVQDLNKSRLFLWLKFHSAKNQEKETVMEQKIHITLRFNLATGKVNLYEIVLLSPLERITRKLLPPSFWVELLGKECYLFRK